jgi:hypothetical protein
MGARRATALRCKSRNKSVPYRFLVRLYTDSERREISVRLLDDFNRSRISGDCWAARKARARFLRLRNFAAALVRERRITVSRSMRVSRASIWRNVEKGWSACESWRAGGRTVVSGMSPPSANAPWRAASITNTPTLIMIPAPRFAGEPTELD